MTERNHTGRTCELLLIKRAIAAADVMPQLAVLIGERRGWRTHRDADRQQRRWELNAWQLLDPMHVSRWSLLDHLDAVRVLGFDPIATGSAARQAA